MAFKRIIEISSGPEGGIGRKVTENYMSFEIERSLTSSVNKAKVKIYNLSQETVAAMGKAGNKLVISAGYEDEGGAAALFFGDINKVTTEQKGVDKVLEMEAFDGQKAVQGKNVVLSFTKGTPTQTVLNTILGVLALPLGSVIPPITSVYSGGYCYAGKAVGALTQVLAREGLKWSIQNEALVVYKDGEIFTPTTLKLTADSGLLSVAPVDQTPGPGTGKKVIKGTSYKFEALLFPQLLPGAQVFIQSTVVIGAVVVQAVKLRGDNRTGDFKCECEAKGF